MEGKTRRHNVLSCILVLFCLTLRMKAQACQSGSKCPQTAPCCRNSNGQPLPPSEGMDWIEPKTGLCSSSLASENEPCSSSCTCAPGLECYRPRTWMCCPPFSCYNATWVKEITEFWDKCFEDPDCPLPL
ncbi:uncharacterized protein LOC133175049 [Saccostrea echinata]|uniref:uncharacterized protein LOC133175049 n=1 Tax=Saccostrea echinata TaxID=191078 RepID=UPI002A807857|nr:uncharacterized protein LOC133175049 [Saccostrea echinata]